VKKLLLRRPEQPDCLLGFASDITELKDAQAATLRSEARFRTLFEASRDAVVVIRQGRIIDGNQAALDMLGVTSRDALRELHPWDVSPAVQPCGKTSEARRGAHGERLRLGHLRVEVLRRHDNGAEVPVDVVLSAMDLDGEPTLLASIRDITDRKLYEAKIHQLAFYDALTGLPNRRLFFDRLAQAVAQSRRSGRHGAVIYLDLDNFKPVNEARPPRRRSAAAGGRPAPRPLPARGRHRGPPGRRRVRRAAGQRGPDHATTRAYVVEVAERIRDASPAQPCCWRSATRGGPAQWSIGARRAWA
jgi:PAS domain S-box-containing protein